MDFTPFLNLLPGNIGMFVACTIIACKLLTVTVRPPENGSRWRVPYRVVSALALNVGWAANRFQAGKPDSLKPPKT